MKYFYIATRLSNGPLADLVAAALTAHGWTETYSWRKHGSVGHLSDADRLPVAEAESSGVCDADALIVLLPGGLGTHVELGVMLGYNWARGDEGYSTQSQIILAAFGSRESGAWKQNGLGYECNFYLLVPEKDRIFIEVTGTSATRELLEAIVTRVVGYAINEKLDKVMESWR